MLTLPKNTKSTKRKSDKQEKQLAKQFEGKITPGSGSKRIKGDVHTKEELIEAKTTAKTQYTVKLKDLQKLSIQADEVNKTPVFVIKLTDEAEGFYFNRDWVLIPLDVYSELRQS